ncbi:MAG: 2-C-methyl-D-erythritol 2,4-cyclodiphosphate synthase [Planctomycetota bacterium]
MIRYGFGIDFHKLEKGKELLLGGITITRKFGAIGDSDADVVLHSLSDAILSAVCKGDLGTIFYKKKGYKSIDMVRFIIDKFLGNKYKIAQINVIIFLEKPLLFDKKEKIKRALSKLLFIDVNSINIQAKTFQRLLSNIVLALSSVIVIENTNSASFV